MTTPSNSSEASSARTSSHKYNLRNPLPLSATQEQEVKKLYYKRVRSHCAPEIKGMYALFSFSFKRPVSIFAIVCCETGVPAPTPPLL